MARRRRWAGFLLVLAVAAGGLGATAAAAWAAHEVEQRHNEQLLDTYADDTGEAVSGEAARYRDTLADMAAAVGAQSDFTIDDFFGVTSRLNRQRFPGATAISFAVAATKSQVPAVQARWRAQGAAELRLRPAGPGPEHTMMVFTRALDATPVAVGTDLSRAPEPAEAMRFARHTRHVVTSRPFVLLRDRKLPSAQQQLSFMFAAPVFGGAGTRQSGQFLGWMVMGMRGTDFLKEAMQARPNPAVAVDLVEASTGTPVVVARSAGATPVTGNRRSRDVVVGQRAWQVRVSATASLLDASDRRAPALTGAAGLIITALLTVLVGTLAGARNRAMAKVDQATAELRKDIERRKAVEAQLQRLALHDPLTDLPNRTLMYERVDHAIAAHRRTANSLAVLFIDLDGFKQVNDTHGHQSGDQLLVEVAARLRTCLRAGDTVARLGGDEFAVLAEQITDPAHAATVAAHVVQALQPPFTVAGDLMRVTASVGLVTHRSELGPATAEEILCRADEAMYAAKTAGKDCYVVAG